jgi:hypothetical protein
MVAVLGSAATGHAEPSHPTFGWFGEVSAWAGKMWTSYKDIAPRSIEPTLTNLQASFGLTIQVLPDLDARIGPVLDGFLAESGGTAFGGAVDLGWTLRGNWKLGPRFSLSKGFGGAAPETGNGIVVMGGARLRGRDFTVGVDALHVTNEHADGTGILIGAGLDGRAGKYAVVVGAAGATLVGLGFLLLVLSVGDTDH